MDVYLVRHAIADQRDPGRWPDDSRRPLTAKGIARIQSAARGLRRIVPEVDVVLSSPYVRAWETAEILHDEAGWPAPERCAELEANRPAGDILGALQAKADRPSVALVGHEPCLSSLASLLLCGNEYALELELKKGGVVLIELARGPGRGGALLRWSASPRMLRSLDSG